jgi:hypothetical protein
MKTLSNPEDKQEILTRLAALTPASKRRWGRMTPNGMICHMNDSLKSTMGERELKAVKPPLPRRFMMFVALWAPLRWPHGIPTTPECDQKIGGTQPVDFESDLAEFHALFERFTEHPRPFEWTPHPMFGPMNDKEWMRWGYRHMDHHLRQFGA